MNRLLVSMIVAPLCALGCGQKTAEVITETAAKASGQNVDVDYDSDGGTMRMKTAEGEVTYNADSAANSVEISGPDGNMVAGDKAALPDNFPDDVPLYDGFKPDMVTTMAQNNVFNVSGPINATLDEIKTFYSENAAAKGWSETMAMAQGQMVMLHYQKDKRVFQVTATAGDPARLAITTSETN